MEVKTAEKTIQRKTHIRPKPQLNIQTRKTEYKKKWGHCRYSLGLYILLLYISSSSGNTLACIVNNLYVSRIHLFTRPANSLVVSVVGLELCTAFMGFEFDSRRFQQLFGTPFSKVSLR